MNVRSPKHSEEVLLSGSEAAAQAALAARVEVVASYAASPPLLTLGRLESWCSGNDLRASLVKVESPYAALSTLIGAAAAGARTFTASSSQGLAQMHELLHWAAGSRLPIVIANINRALGAPWSLWVDHNDSLSQRDTGWIQFYASSSQEVFDTILQAYRLAESVLLPIMVNLDGFYLSHTVEPVRLPSAEESDAFLPPYRNDLWLDPARPHSFGNVASPDYYQEFRFKIEESMRAAASQADDIYQDFEERFGRKYAALETYELSDAEVVFIAYATMAQTVKHTVRLMRRQGKRVGMIRLRMFRPFPGDGLRRLIRPGCRYIVLDRNISLGAEGILGQEVRSVLGSRLADISLISVTLGLGGRDVTPTVIEDIETRYSGEDAASGGHFWEGVRQ